MQQKRPLPEPEYIRRQQEAEIAEYQEKIAELKKELESVEEALEIQSFGFYRPRYGFDSSDDYKYRLDGVREHQKSLVRMDNATECDTEWTVEGSLAKGKQMVRQQSKLMLRAFNGECDAAIAKVKYDNIKKLESRIAKSWEAINKLGDSKQVRISDAYFRAKMDELHLVHEHREKVQQEREIEREQRETMREEERAEMEIERAQEQAEKDEAKFSRELEKAKKQMAEAKGRQLDRLEALVQKLETELSAAIDRKAKAVARAQLTRSGHVYVLSNVGSFGDGVYKIGMTRRLEPLERVKELGDASVPFFFDVHAMVYSKDAPALETALHNEFADRRVNKVNMRREFFRVSLEEIKMAIAKHHGAVTVVTQADAEHYRKTCAMESETNQASPVQ